MEWWQILLVVLAAVVAVVVTLGLLIEWLLCHMASGFWFAPEEEEEDNGDR